MTASPTALQGPAGPRPSAPPDRPHNDRTQSVVVIGGGLGGLSAAASLRARDFQVTLLEKNDRLGGKLNVSEKQGFSFDLGPSIFTLPQIFRDLFERAGKSMDDYLQLEAVTPHWRNFFENGLQLDLLDDDASMKRELRKLEGDPDSHWRDLQRFLDYGRRQYKLVESGYFAKGLDTLWEFIRFYGFFRLAVRMDYGRTMSQAIRRYFRDPHLRSVFEYFIKYVGSSALSAPGYMNLMPVIQFDYGLWYVKGGMYNLARALEKLLADLSVTVRTGCGVSQIEKRDGRVTGVVLESGERLPADFVVCNMEVIPAYERLLGEPSEFIEKLQRFAPACSGLVIHLGTDRVYPQLAHHNFFYSRDQEKHFQTVFRDHQLPDDPTIYLVAPTRTDPSKAPAGCDNLKILPHIPPIDPDRPLGPDDYEALKERVLVKLERMGLTGLRQHVVIEETLTPVDIERMYNSNRGSIYGVVTDWKLNKGFKAPKQSSRYANLFFTGGSVNPGGGMPMAVLSGQKASDRLADAAAKLPRTS